MSDCGGYALIRLFRKLEFLTVSGEPISPATRKAGLLVAVLALQGEKGIGREPLCEIFWPHRSEPQARGSLRQALAAIRKLLAAMGDGSPRLIADMETVRLLGDAASIDAQLFERLARRADVQDRAAAAELYQGDLLADVALPEPLEEWLAPFRRAFRNRALELCEELSQTAADGGSPAAQACERLAERLLAADSAAEEAHRALIRLYRARGRTNAAHQQFELCREALHRLLGVEPEIRTRELLTPRLRSSEVAQDGAPVEATPAIAGSRDKEQPSVAVMPFDNLSGEGDDYFVDGVVEEITAALSRVRDFFVIARQSAFTYKGRFADVREVGRELGVNYVVEGTVRRGGDRLRISVQLVDAETRAQLWSGRFEGAIEDVFEFQDRIAAQVAGAIRPAIRSAEIEISKLKAPASLRAHDLVMRAYPNLWGHHKESNQKAIELLRQAIATDPGYGRAHALLAWCHAINAAYLWTPDPELEQERAQSEVGAAAGSINDDPTALTAVGAATSLCGDQERATAYLEGALALDPNNAWAWTRFGWVAFYKGETDRAIERFGRAMTLSPLDPFAFNMRMGMATAKAMAGSFSEAIAIARDIMSNHPEVTWCYRVLAAWSALNGDLESARWAARKLLHSQPDFTIGRYRALPMFRHVPQWEDRLAEGLRLAGLPER